MRLLSRAAVPLHLRGPDADARCLGVAVAALRLDGAALPLDDARLGAGWHAAEPELRWTDGAADIDVRGARRLALRIALTERYWLAPRPAATRPLPRPSHLKPERTGTRHVRIKRQPVFQRREGAAAAVGAVAQAAGEADADGGALQVDAVGIGDVGGGADRRAHGDDMHRRRLAPARGGAA